MRLLPRRQAGKFEFDKDDKDEKKTAREMMQMMFAINKNNFDGKRGVTCNTCHRGSPHPQAIPAILAEAPKPEAMEAMHEHEHGSRPRCLRALRCSRSTFRRSAARPRSPKFPTAWKRATR